MLQALRKKSCSVKGTDTGTMNNKKQPSEVFYKKAVLENFSVFTGKCLLLVLESLVNEVMGLQICSFIKKRLLYGWFSVNIAEFLKKLILKKICGRLLLNNVKRN